jgi:hypothetical protein
MKWGMKCCPRVFLRQNSVRVSTQFASTGQPTPTPIAILYSNYILKLRRADKALSKRQTHNPSRQKLQHEQPMQAEATDSGLHEHGRVEERPPLFAPEAVAVWCRPLDFQ